MSKKDSEDRRMREADRKGREQDKLREDYRKLKETRKYVEKREGLLKRFLNAVNKGDGHQ